jgi:hypothetical protein
MKVKKVVLHTYYNLDGEYIPFPDNPLHNQTYENVNVVFKKEINVIHGMRFISDIIDIQGHESIDCELINHYKDPNGTLIIRLCQDWG